MATIRLVGRPRRGRGPRTHPPADSRVPDRPGGRQRTEEEAGRRIQESQRARQRNPSDPVTTGNPLQRDREVTREQGPRGQRIRRRPPVPGKGGEKRSKKQEERGETLAPPTPATQPSPGPGKRGRVGTPADFSPASTSGSFDSLFRVLFDFPSRYLSSIGFSSRI